MSPTTPWRGDETPTPKGPVVGWRWANALRALHAAQLAYEEQPEGVRAALAEAAAVEDLRHGLRSLAEYHLDRRNPPPGHAGYREPELPTSEWRAAYFVLARIALEQLDECRSLLPMATGETNIAEIFAHHDAMGCCDPKTTEHLWQSVAPAVSGLVGALRDARLTILAHHFERAYDLRTRPSVVRTQVREIDRLLGEPPTDFDRARETI